MKIIIIMGLWLISVSGRTFGYGLVNNSTASVSAEDSLCIEFFNLDSLGRNIGGLDTVKIMTYYPNGDSAFCEVIAGISGRVKMSVDNGDTAYRWAAQVSDIDGSGRAGLYTVKITAKSDQTGGWLTTPRTFSFQLIEREFNDALVMTIDSLQAVLDSLQSLHNWVGGSGDGPISYQVLTLDSTIHQIIPGVNVAIRNLSQTALMALNCTDAAGGAVFNLSADSFLAVPFSPGYIFTGFDTLIVVGSGSDTLYGYRFDPGTPSSPELCRAYGFLYDISGRPENNAVVTAWLPSGVSRQDNGIISPFKITALSDTTGYFYLDLIPNATLVPDTSKYEITITRADGTILRQRVVVPDSPSWLLTW